MDGSSTGTPPTVLLEDNHGTWTAVAVDDAWAAMAGRPADRLVGSVIGGLLDDRFAAERLSRLCDLADLTGGRKQVTITTARDVVLRAAAEPVEADDGRRLLRLVVVPGGEQEPPALPSDTELVVVFDQQLRGIEVDDAALRVSGLSRDQVLGYTNREMGYPPHLADLWDGHHRAVLATGATHVLEHELPTVAGPRTFRTVVTPLRDGAGTPVAVRVASRDLSSERLEAATRPAPGGTSAMWLRLQPVPGAASTARAHARDWLERHLPGRPVEPVLLAVSELVTNAALHAGTDLVLQVSHVEGGTVRVEVWDASSAVPLIGRPGTVGGRGLALVELLSTEWGSEPTEDAGKCVWCEIALPEPGSAAGEGSGEGRAPAPALRRSQDGTAADDGAAAAAFWADDDATG